MAGSLTRPGRSGDVPFRPHSSNPEPTSTTGRPGPRSTPISSRKPVSRHGPTPASPRAGADCSWPAASASRGVEADRGVDPRGRPAPRPPPGRSRRKTSRVSPGLPARRGGHLAAQLLAGVAHMAGLLHHVDAGHPAHQRLDPARRGRSAAASSPGPPPPAASPVKEPGVVETVFSSRPQTPWWSRPGRLDRGAGLPDHRAGEHHRVPALVGDLGQRVAHVLCWSRRRS